MKRSLVPQDQQGVGDELLKLTSLLYLKEALAQEAYEDCAELIATAKDNGATGDEVKEAIAEHLGVVKERYGKRPVAFRKR